MTATLRALLVNSSRDLGIETQHLKDLAADGDVQIALLQDAILLRDSGQPDQSLALLDEAVRAGISGDWIDDNRARALVHLNRRSEALAIWDQLAVSSDHGVRQMASEMAQLLRQQQSVEDLWSNLHQVLQVAGCAARFLPATPPPALPDLELPLLQEAIALREAGDSALSLQLLAAAAGGGMASAWIDDNRARALVNQERYGEAVALWRPLLHSDIPALRDGAAAMLLLNEGRALQQAGSAEVLAGERLANGLGRRAYGRWISHHEPRLPDPLLPLQLPFWSIDELGALCALQGGAGHAIWPAPLGQSTWPLDGWLLLLHPQAQLRPGALQALEQWLMQGPADPHQRYPGGWVLPDLIYADEDRLDQQGCRCDPWFKPGWVPESFWSSPWLETMSVWRVSWLRQHELPLPPSDADDRFCWQLDALERSPRTEHCPLLLVHQGAQPGPPSAAQAQALLQHLRRQDEAVEAVTPLPHRPGCFGLQWALPASVCVSVLIPTKDRADLLQVCLATLWDSTAAERDSGLELEIIVIDNGSQQQATADLLSQWQQRLGERLQVLSCDAPFNWSRLNNLAAAMAAGELLLCLNNDVEARQPGWLQAMVAQALRPAVGCVGANLLYADGTLQHGGVVIGMQGDANHAYHHCPLDHGIHRGRSRLLSGWGAVTGACLMLRRELLLRCGGFDEGLPVEFNDVDLCLRLSALGYRHVVPPQAVLIHHESQSRQISASSTMAPAQLRLRRRWSQRLLDGSPWWPRQAELHFADGRPLGLAALGGEPR